MCWILSRLVLFEAPAQASLVARYVDAPWPLSRDEVGVCHQARTSNAGKRARDTLKDVGGAHLRASKTPVALRAVRLVHFYLNILSKTGVARLDGAHSLDQFLDQS